MDENNTFAAFAQISEDEQARLLSYDSDDDNPLSHKNTRTHDRPHTHTLVTTKRFRIKLSLVTMNYVHDSISFPPVHHIIVSL